MSFEHAASNMATITSSSDSTTTSTSERSLSLRHSSSSSQTDRNSRDSSKDRIDVPASAKTRKRRGGPKVRSACITCKIRRVKCDETRPHCRRCLGYWGYCEGYTVPFKRERDQVSHASRQLQPKSNKFVDIIPPNQRLYSYRKVVTPVQILGQPYTGPAFKSSDEQEYFELFLKSTSPALTGAFNDPIWGYLMPQRSITEPFVRYGIAALGAMTSTFMEVMAARGNGDLGDDENCLGWSQKYKTAISLYDRSIHHMRIALSNPGHSFRDVLLGCLLVVCFEGYHGHNYTAMVQALSGLKLLQSWTSKQPGITSTINPIRSPDSAVVDDDLVAAFGRLDTQVLSFFDTRSASDHAALATQGDKALQSIPSVFLSLSQARLFWDLIVQRSSHFLASVVSTTSLPSPALVFRGPNHPYPEDVELPTGIKLFAQHIPLPEIPHYSDALERHTSEITTWLDAYAPLFKQVGVAGHAQSRGATILLMHAKMNQILLKSAFFQSEMSYDALLPEFQAIFNLAESIWTSHVVAYTEGVSYNFELGVLPPLFILCTRCRDRSLRRQAISLLFSAFHRENVWDSFGVGYIARWVMSMEEIGKGPVEQRLIIKYVGEDGPVVALQELEADRENEIPPNQITPEANANTDNQLHPDPKIQTESPSPVGAPGYNESFIIPEAHRIRITGFNIDLNMRRAQLEYTTGPVNKSGSGNPRKYRDQISMMTREPPIDVVLNRHVVRW